MEVKRTLLVLFSAPALVLGQQRSEMQQILERLDRLEQENRALMEEVRALRQELAPDPEQPASTKAAGQAPSPLQEQVAVEEHRTEELEQSKVESSQRLPVSLTGMLLFNAFLNGKGNGGFEYPVTASSPTHDQVGGATLAQTVLGLKFQGPQIAGGGKVSGSLFMDFFGGTNSALNHLLRIRVATVQVDWKDQSFTVGQDKPIISPREPNSLAQVAVSPLTDAGNLWLWEPQARFEQRFHFGEETGLRAQIGVYQTSEGGNPVPSEYASTLGRARPALQGRFELWHDFGGGRRIEIAPGFDTSSTHILGRSLPSNAFSVDWLIRPAARLDFSGMFFSGQNLAVLGALRQGLTFRRDYVNTVHGTGGWAQISFRATPRLTFNIYGGQQDDRNSDLLTGNIAKNQVYASNAIYRLGPNVLAGLEASQTRTTYIGSGVRLNNHYDLALAYLF